VVLPERLLDRFCVALPERPAVREEEPDEDVDRRTLREEVDVFFAGSAAVLFRFVVAENPVEDTDLV